LTVSEEGKSPPPEFELKQALTPFSTDEARKLRRYVHLATQLKESGFFQQRCQSLEINFSEEGMSFDLPHGEDEELITVMVARLRKLHTEGPSGTASFIRIVRLMRAHTSAIDNVSADWFRTVLDHFQSEAERASRSALIGLTIEPVNGKGKAPTPISPEEMFWDWVYGVYLHDDPERLARVEAWKGIGAHKFNFLKIASDLGKVYFGFTGIVQEVLDEPELVEAP
jgi:hypothetical protein